MNHSNLRGLFLSGGGAHGAYQVGVLKYIHEHFCAGEASPFRIFTGTSCGALNCCFYAAQSHDARQSRLWLEELWMNFHIPAYHRHVLKSALLRSLQPSWLKTDRESSNDSWSILDPRPMQDTIEKGFLRKNLDQAFSEETTLGLAVAATEMISARCCWFTDGPLASSWNLFHSIGKTERIIPAHAAASASVPIFMPPVKLGDRYFLDGSISLERPLSAAVALGATKILSISTESPYPDELPTYSPFFKPRLSNVISMLLNRLGSDNVADETVQIETLNLFYEALEKKHRRPQEKPKRLPLFHKEALPSDYQPVEVFRMYPSQRLKHVSVDVDYGHGDRVQRKATTFMFNRKFTVRLIQMGYEDAAARREDLQNFFREKDKPRSRPFRPPIKTTD